MEDLIKRLELLQVAVNNTTNQLSINALQQKLDDLHKEAQQPGFWNDNMLAQNNLKEQAKLETRVSPWISLLKDTQELNDLAKLKDNSLRQDIQIQLTKLEDTYDQLKDQLKLAGQYDDHDAIVSIYAGAGGTDAQDWAQMLLRMYVRWAEKQKLSIKTIQESPGETAGLKSVTLELAGNFVYGKLAGENGVHRLVRLSPFNSDNLRQTSFAKVEVLPKINQPSELIIDEKDLKIDVYRAGGHGGQSVNTTDSAVRVTHVPTGINVAIQNERSQLQNKETAMTILRSRLVQLKQEQHLENLAELKGPNEQASWGNQIRSYVLHPYKQVKDLQTGYETSDPDKVLDGDINNFINAHLEKNLNQSQVSHLRPLAK